MTVTYTDEAVRNTSATSESFVPRYARAKRARKGVRTWMILAPIGAVVLIGGGAAMLMSGGESQPLAEPAPAAAVIQPIEALSAPLETSTAPAALVNNAVEPAAAPVPVVREATPERAPAERRAAPALTSSATVATPEVVQPAGPQPYLAQTAPATPSIAPTPLSPVVTPAPNAPAIQTTPLN